MAVALDMQQYFIMSCDFHLLCFIDTSTDVEQPNIFGNKLNVMKMDNSLMGHCYMMSVNKDLNVPHWARLVGIT